MTGVLSCTSKVNFIEYVLSIWMKINVGYLIRKTLEVICTKSFVYRRRAQGSILSYMNDAWYVSSNE